MNLSEVDFGKVDARNEILFQTAEEKKSFSDIFVDPFDVQVADFIAGKKFIIFGLKGTGKSALMHFIKFKVEENIHVKSKIFYFSNSFKKADLESARKRAAEKNAEIANLDFEKNTLFAEDYVLAWKWYLHVEIAVALKTSESIVKNNESLKQYTNLVLGEGWAGLRARIAQIAQRAISGSTLEISANPKFCFSLDWNDAELRNDVSDMLRSAEILFSQLKQYVGKMYLFFDEIELRLNSEREYQRDILIIRDFIVAVRDINEASRSAHYAVQIICGLRLEVLSEIGIVGPGFARIIRDFGSLLDWSSPATDGVLHPLLKMPCARIRKNLGKHANHLTDEQIFIKYFRDRDNNIAPITADYQKLILDNTLYRPRDVVNFFNSIKHSLKDKELFARHELRTINKDYSHSIWEDISEGLSFKFSGVEISGISILIPNLGKKFAYTAFKSNITRLRDEFNEIAALAEERRAASLVRDLYKLGAIGAFFETEARFIFRGTDEPRLNEAAQFQFHKALYPHFGFRFD